MSWENFHSEFDLKIFDKFIESMTIRKTKVRGKIQISPIVNPQFKYELLPFETVSDRYVVRYNKSSVKKNDYTETNVLGYFQRFEKGLVFVSTDTSHVWKKFRDIYMTENSVAISVHNNVKLLGANLVFADFSSFETNKRYHFLINGQIDESSFIFKADCVRINDIYIGSNKSCRYFIVQDCHYSSSDYLSNNVIRNKKFFQDLKDLSTDDFIMIFDNYGTILEDYDAMSKRYGDKTIKKLLKI